MCGGDIAAHLTKGIGAILTTKTARNLLFQFGHPDIALRLVIVEGNGKVFHKCQYHIRVVSESIQQVFGQGLFDPSALLGLVLVGFGGRVDP